MLILGWHGNPRATESDDLPSFAYHDSAAALLCDGVVVAAIEEERLNRVKHSSFFPVRAIRFCLDQARVTFADIDVIATDCAEEFCDFIVTRDAALDPSRSFMSGREFVGSTFETVFQADVRSKLQFYRHHLAHLYTASYPSGFSHGLALCLDGDGDSASGLVARFSGDDFEVLRYLPEALSVGTFYTQQLFFLGYKAFDEYKAMGLAPYGDSRVYDPLFSRLYTLQPEGRFTIVPWSERIALMKQAGLMSTARRKGEVFHQHHKDYAAALQAALERIVEHIVVHFQRITNTQNLCISGGVAHNCTLNGRILRSGRFQQVYVQPAAHDAGNAIGAAFAAARQSGQSIRRPAMPHLFLGTDIGATEIGSRLHAWAPLIQATQLENAPQKGAELLARGAVVAWVQGRSEFGPRALGNRSILADARPAANKLIINSMIKKREEYRPFAPAVLEERLADYFEVPEGVTMSYMVIVVPVLPHARQELGAVTHVDGTARVQSVSRTWNPRFHALIDAFGVLTGMPVVLNTSFNNNAEPIVDSVDDAVTTFLTTGIDALIVDDWLVERSQGRPLSSAVLDLVPSLPRSRKLTRRSSADGPWRFSLDSTAHRAAGETAVTISGALFELLLDDSGTTLRHRCEQRLSCDSTIRSIGEESLRMWTDRVLCLKPVERDVSPISGRPHWDIKSTNDTTSAESYRRTADAADTLPDPKQCQY